MFNGPAKKKPGKADHEFFNFTLDEDMIDTAKHMKAAEGKVGSKLSLEGVKNGGMDLIDRYDNTRLTFEKDTPHGNQWWRPYKQVEAEEAAKKKEGKEDKDKLDDSGERKGDVKKAEEMKKADAKKEEAKKDDSKKADTKKEDAKKAETKKEDAKKTDAKK